MLIRIIFVLSLCAIVLGANVNVCYKGHSQDYEDRIYTFGFSNYLFGSYLSGGVVEGSFVDLMNKVCQLAGKRCEAMYVADFDFMADRQGYSTVLNQKWLDVAFSMTKLPSRMGLYDFSTITIIKEPSVVVVTRTDSGVTLDGINDPRNQYVLAYLNIEGTSVSNFLDLYRVQHFVYEEGLQGVDGNDIQDVFNTLKKLILDPCSGVDITILPAHDVEGNEKLKIISTLKPSIGEASIMVRKDSRYILEWWDCALKSFMLQTSQYLEYCQSIKNKYGGATALHCPDAQQF